MKTILRIHPSDLVAVALAPLSGGSVLEVDGQSVTLLEDIPQGHKFALAPISEGSPVIKYGASIGLAKADIPTGGWVHVHNIRTGLGDVLDYTYEPDNAPLPPTDDILFRGYRREDGRSAVRNEIWIIPTVGCVNNVAQAIERRAQKFKTGTIDENPSPGNKKGGISTLEHKSLGCTQKSGSAPVSGVLASGEPVQTRGLNLLSAPGNDLVASTALAASGCHIVLFTTGRGTPFASPVPTVKIVSNSALAGKKKNWIDFNCGVLAEDGAVAELGQTLFDFVPEVASGKEVKAEEAGFHDMAIFRQGVTL